MGSENGAKGNSGGSFPRAPPPPTTSHHSVLLPVAVVYAPDVLGAGGGGLFTDLVRVANRIGKQIARRRAAALGLGEHDGTSDGVSLRATSSPFVLLSAKITLIELEPAVRTDIANRGCIARAITDSNDDNVIVVAVDRCGKLLFLFFEHTQRQKFAQIVQSKAIKLYPSLRFALRENGVYERYINGLIGINSAKLYEFRVPPRERERIEIKNRSILLISPFYLFHRLHILFVTSDRKKLNKMSQLIRTY